MPGEIKYSDKIFKLLSNLRCSSTHTSAPSLPELQKVTHATIRFSVVKEYSASRCPIKKMYTCSFNSVRVDSEGVIMG